MFLWLNLEKLFVVGSFADDHEATVLFTDANTGSAIAIRIRVAMAMRIRLFLGVDLGRLPLGHYLEHSESTVERLQRLHNGRLDGRAVHQEQLVEAEASRMKARPISNGGSRERTFGIVKDDLDKLSHGLAGEIAHLKDTVGAVREDHAEELTLEFKEIQANTNKGIILTSSIEGISLGRGEGTSAPDHCARICNLVPADQRPACRKLLADWARAASL